MAVRTYGTSDPLTNKLYAMKLAVESIPHTFIRNFMGKGPNSLIQERYETSKNAGDRITIGLRVKLSGGGTLGGATLEGNEERFDTQDDSIIINRLRHATRVKGKGTMSQQRVPFDLRNEALDNLAQWWADRQDDWFANQVCGNNANGDVRFTGLQNALAPDAAHIIRPSNGTGTALATDQAVAAAGAGANGENLFQLKAIDVCVEKAQTIAPIIRPIEYGGQRWYVCFVHPHQVTSLRTQFADGGWFDIQGKLIQGGERTGNPLFTGALGTWNQTILHSWERISQGVDSGTSASVANTRRAAFCGAQAAWCAYGRGYAAGRLSWVEKLFDYDDELGVAAGCNAGLKKSRFNGADFGTIAITTFAEASDTY